MPPEPHINEIRCEFSKRFANTQGELDLARYKLRPLPTRYGGLQEAILVFQEDMKNGHANSEAEGEMVLSFLSLLFNSTAKKTGYRINSFDISGSTQKRRQFTDLFEGPLELSDYSTNVTKLFSLGEQLTKQYIRACNAYSLAITSVELDTSLSFLLLVTALECISTQEQFLPNSELDKSKKSTERYCRLVEKYCIDVPSLHPNGNESAFLRELKTVYYSHRSAFVHGGKEVSIAAQVADNAGFDSIGHFVDGKEVFTPGLKWFFRVTRGTLLGFLANYARPTEDSDPEVLSRIASDRAVLTIRVGGV